MSTLSFARLLTLWGALALWGCNDTLPSTTPAPQVERPQEIALVMKTLTNPFFVAMERGARRAEEEFGFLLTVKTAAQETSTEQQIAIIEQLIQRGVDAIVFAPADSYRLIPVLKRAQEADIVLVNIDNAIDAEFAQQHGLAEIPFISVDNEMSSYQVARHLGERVPKPAQIAILEGIRTASNAQARHRGAQRAFREIAQIEIVASETAHWKIDEGYSVTRQLLQRFPDLDAIYACNDMMALGALRFLAEADRSDILVAGYDALPEAKTAIQEGKMLASVDQRADEQAYLGVRYALQLLAGQAVAPVTIIDTQLVVGDTL